MKQPEDSLTADELYSLRLHARDRHGERVSQKQLAAWCGVTANTVARRERGELAMSVETRRCIVYALAEHTGRPLRAIRAAIAERRDAIAASQARFARLSEPPKPRKRLGRPARKDRRR